MLLDLFFLQNICKLLEIGIIAYAFFKYTLKYLFI